MVTAYAKGKEKVDQFRLTWQLVTTPYLPSNDCFVSNITFCVFLEPKTMLKARAEKQKLGCNYAARGETKQK